MHFPPLSTRLDGSIPRGGEDVELVDAESKEDDCNQDLLEIRTIQNKNNETNDHAPSDFSSCSSGSDEEVHLHRDFERVKVPKRCCTDSEKAKEIIKASYGEWPETLTLILKP